MLFIVNGNFDRSGWEKSGKALQARSRKPEVKAVLELLVPGGSRFTGVYESKDATSLHKYLGKLPGLQVMEVMPALPLDNILILEEMGGRG